MTPKQLAQHWQISKTEAENISDFINNSYQLDVVPIAESTETFWQGVMYAHDPHNKYILMESQDKFASRDQAILHWTNQMHHHILPKDQAKLMRSGHGVPTDAYLALTPVEGYERVIEQATTPVLRLNKEVFKQRD